MSNALRDFVSAVFRSDHLQVPYFNGEASTSVLSFLRGTLEVDVHQPIDYPGRFLNKRFNKKLLTQTASDGTELSHLLVSLLKPLLSRTAGFQRSHDRHLLSICLLYALRLKPRIPVEDIEALLTVFSDASSFMQPNEAADAFWECIRMVMFASLQTFLPEESDERAAEDVDESLLESLATSPALERYFQGTPDISDPMRLVLQFAYVLLQLRCNSRAVHEALQERLEVCYKVGVFRALREILSDRIFTQNFSSHDQTLCFETAYRLLVMFFEVETRRLTTPRHVLHRNTAQLVESGGKPGQGGDDFCSLMQCLALVFTHCPDVIVKATSEHTVSFVSWVPESKFLERSATVMTSYIQVISALATGENGVDRIFYQLVEGARNQFSVSNEGFKYISWDFILKSLLDLCDILIRHKQTPTLGVSNEELSGFAAYLKLFGKLFHVGPPAVVGRRIARLESEFRSALRKERLQDILLLIFCKPVPAQLKAAACDALSGMGRAPGAANTILSNLKCVGLFATADDTRRVNRHYLHSQLASIEAPMNDYSCTISTIRMINELLINADQLPDKETAMLEVTQFCKGVVLDSIWKHLRFEDNSQLWELLAVVFEHFLICVERIAVDTFPTILPNNISPGQTVLRDILGQGVIYDAMRSCAVKFYSEHTSHYFASNSAHRAVVNLLDLMLAVFEAEPSVQFLPPHGFRSFRDTMLQDKDIVQKTLFSVDASLPAEIQTASVEVLRRLFGPSPDQLTILDQDVQISLFHALGRIYNHNLQF